MELICPVAAAGARFVMWECGEAGEEEDDVGAMDVAVNRGLRSGMRLLSDGAEFHAHTALQRSTLA